MWQYVIMMPCDVGTSLLGSPEKAGCCWLCLSHFLFLFLFRGWQPTEKPIPPSGVWCQQQPALQGEHGCDWAEPGTVMPTQWTAGASAAQSPQLNNSAPIRETNWTTCMKLRFGEPCPHINSRAAATFFQNCPKKARKPPLIILWETLEEWN